MKVQIGLALPAQSGSFGNYVNRARNPCNFQVDEPGQATRVARVRFPTQTQTKGPVMKQELRGHLERSDHPATAPHTEVLRRGAFDSVEEHVSDGRARRQGSQGKRPIATSEQPGLATERRRLALSAAVSGVLLTGVCHAATRNWSNAAGWPGGVLPTANAMVTLAPNDDVILDVDPPNLRGLYIPAGAKLTFSDAADRLLRVDYIEVRGTLQVGTSAVPYSHKATIRLTWTPPGTPPLPPPPYEVQTLAVKAGGVLSLHGTDKLATWTRLATTASATTSQIQLQTTTKWNPGDLIVITSTDFDETHNEVLPVQSVAGTVVTLNGALKWTHRGTTEGLAYDPSGVEERAEVGLLTHNVVIEGTPTTINGYTFGGQTRMDDPGATTTPSCDISNVEFRYLGKEEDLGKYPFHFHEIKSSSTSYVEKSSFHDCYNRWLSIHETQGVRVEDNVGYDTIGHGYYIEDVTVTSCKLEHNLGVRVKKTRNTTNPHGLNQDDTPGVFWLDSPQNIVVNNAAASSDFCGFWFEATGVGTGLNHDAWGYLANSKFDGNVAHSNLHHGFYGDHRPAPIQSSTMSNCTAYKNREFGYWIRSYGQSRLVNCDSADNRGGYYLASEGYQTDYTDPAGDGILMNGISNAILRDSLVIGVSTNTPTDYPQKSITPCPPLPEWEPLSGVELYDGLIGVVNCRFASFAPVMIPFGSTSYLRNAGAIASVYSPSVWMVEPRNYVDSCSFVNTTTIATNPVYLRTPIYSAVACGNIGDNGVANAIVFDKSGSITGAAGSRIVPNNPFLSRTSGAPPPFNSSFNAFVLGPVSSTSTPPRAPLAQLEIDAFNAYTAAGIALPAVANRASYLDFVPLGSAPGTYRCYAPGSANPPPFPNQMRYPTNALTDDSYQVAYPSGPSPSNYYSALNLNLQFTLPGHYVVLKIPMPTAWTPQSVWIFYNNSLLDMTPFMSASSAAVTASTIPAWYVDPSHTDTDAQRFLYVKLYSNDFPGTPGMNQTVSFMVK